LLSCTGKPSTTGEPRGPNHAFSLQIDVRYVFGAAVSQRIQPPATLDSDSPAPGRGARDAADVIERLEWHSDRVLHDDLTFRLPRRATGAWAESQECLDFYKLPKLVNQYGSFLRRHPDLQPNHLLELGIFGGGSMALWFECFRPRKHVGIDIKRSADSDYFRRFVASRRAEGRLTTYWDTSQDDTSALRRIVEREFDGHLDLVIDDASHFYEPTRASFNFLFPFLRPGGLYVIEDWAWAHWRDVNLSPKFLRRAAKLTNFVTELVQAAGTDLELIPRVEIHQGFTVVERGPASLTPGRFRLEERIYRRRVPLGVSFHRSLGPR
jgi:cephalosporin hydroxylase